MIALDMDIASMVHAIAALVGLEMTAPRRFAPTDALDMESASTHPAFASQHTLVSIAHC